LRPRDRITFELPYGAFTYEVRRHMIVKSDDLRPLRSHGREVLALQACHPRFFATHRYIVYAVPVHAIRRTLSISGRPRRFRARPDASPRNS
jgi:sortase A